MNSSFTDFALRYIPMVILAGAVAAAVLMPHAAFASTSDTSTGNLPWEAPLASIRNSFSGPVAFAVALIGIVVCGAMLVWGGDINEFARRAIMLVLVLALIVLANSVLTSLFSQAELVSQVSPFGTMPTHAGIG